MTRKTQALRNLIGYLLAAASFASTQLAYAFEACLPPECKAPVALEEFANYGNTPLDKILMALSLLCAWLLVWGVFFIACRKPRRKAPIGLLDPESIKIHDKLQDAEQLAWKAIRENPQARSAMRRQGVAMVSIGIAFGAVLVQYDSRDSIDLAGTTALMKRWTGEGFSVEKEILLLEKGRACLRQAGGCSAWGTWHASANTLTLIPLARDESFMRLYADDSSVRYWAKPSKGDELSFGAFLDLPKKQVTEAHFTHAQTQSPLTN